MEYAVTVVSSLQTFQPDESGAASSGGLLALARSRATSDRERLLLGIAALCDATPPGAGAAQALTDIFMTLAGQAEHDIRKALAESISSADWAPTALINMLALDEIEIARPVIARSRLLDDTQLLRILVEATVEHHIEVARRPGLSGRVADAIIDAAEPATMTALASNRSAEISDDGLRRLVEQSRRIAALRAPLTRHPRLNAALAAELYRWVGDALREAIFERFRVDHAAMAHAIDFAVDRAGPRRALPAKVADSDVAAREEMERRLVDKLQSAGQLRASFLIRAVREKRLSLFEYGLAALTGFTVAEVRRAVMHRSPDALFLACGAVGIDRAVFPTVLKDIRRLTDGFPGEPSGSDGAGPPLSPVEAAREFRALVGPRADEPPA